MKGRKRHILTDTQGFIKGCYVGPADENDRTALKYLLTKSTKDLLPTEKILADMGYQSNALKDYLQEHYGIRFEIIKRPRKGGWFSVDLPMSVGLARLPQPGFHLLPKRWIVERTFAWINRNRRLSKDYEFHTSTSENFIYLSMIKLLLRRWDVALL